MNELFTNRKRCAAQVTDYLGSVKDPCELMGVFYVPMYLAYTERASARSSVPPTIARPSGKTVTW